MTSPTTMLSTSTDSLLNHYVGWLIRQHRTLFIEEGIRQAGRLPPMPIEMVYATLRGDQSNSFERVQSYMLLEKEWRVLLEQEWHHWETQLDLQELSPEQVREARWRFLAQAPFMPTLVERDRTPLLHDDQTERAKKEVSLNFGEAFRRQRLLVILGDPGSGKTTLARWLTLKLAQALASDKQRVLIPAYQVDPTKARNDEGQFDLGPIRLPVLVRVADFAEARRNAQLLLADYLGYHQWLGERPTDGLEPLPPHELNTLIKTFLHQGRAVIILDGMDEISSNDSREEIVEEIERFIARWISDRGEFTRWEEPLFDDQPAIQDGNQLVVTSRIAGYHASPLTGNFAHFTIEPMKDKVVDRFCDVWTETVYFQDAEAGDSIREIERRAKKAATSLKEAIHDKSRPGVRELASNPLLLNILAIVHRNSKGQLPEQRVRLYQIMVDTLVEVWRNYGWKVDEVNQVLAPLAVHIHEHYPTGLLAEEEVRQQVTEHLAYYRGIENCLDATFLDEVDNFLRAMREEVGLLAARGEYLYGFLHLTFQEYFAALYLVQDPFSAAEEILKRIDSPRWREPILLALGFFSLPPFGNRPRERLLHKLLNDPKDTLKDLLPQRARLITEALPELGYVPPRVVEDIARRLLEAYAKQKDFGQLELLCEQVEETFTRLRQGKNLPIVDRMLKNMLTNPPTNNQAFVPAAATLIQRKKWFTPELTAALLLAIPNDDRSWGWPIDRTLRELITPARSTAKSQTLPKEPLPFRSALESDPTLAEQVMADPAWLRLVIALYGGYSDYETPTTKQEYYEMATYLQLKDRDRDPYIEFYGYKWGREDPIYQMALYLDTTGAQMKKNWEIKPRFVVEYIYRDSPLTPLILSALCNGQKATSLIPCLWQSWHPAKQTSWQADALVALAALGEDVTWALKSACTAQPAVAEKAIAQFSRLSHSLQDPVTRAATHAIDSLKRLKHQLPPTRWTDVVANTLQVLIAYGSQPVNTYQLDSDDLCQKERAYIQAESWANWFSGTSHEFVYDVAVVLDTIGKKLSNPPQLLARTFATAHTARNLKWDNHIGWPLEQLPPRQIDSDDIPLETLTAIENVCSELSFIRNWALTSFKPLIVQNPDLLPEILALNLGDTDVRSDPQNTLQTLAPQLVEHPTPRQEILKMARAVKKPYHRSRALLRLAFYLPAQHDALLAEALEAARKIDNAHKRARVLERLARHYDRQERRALLDETLATTRAMTDPDNRARALGRLVFHVQSEARLALLSEALAAVRQIVNEQHRAETLKALHPALIAYPELVTESQAIARHIQDEWCRAKALDLQAPHLLPLHQKLAQTSEEAAHTWAPIVLAAIVNDLNKQFIPFTTLNNIWAALLSSRRSEALELLRERGRNGKLVFTLAAASVLDKLLSMKQTQIVHALLPLLRKPEAEVFPLLESWRQGSDPFVANCAALLLAEVEGFSFKTVQKIIDLLSEDDDLLRYRAALVLHSNNTSADKDKRRLRTSTLGQETLAILARAGRQFYQQKDSLVTLTVGYLWSDLIYDDAQTIETWTQVLSSDGQEATGAKKILRYIEMLTPQAWQAFHAALRDGPISVQKALLKSLCRLVELKNKLPDEVWNELQPTLQALDDTAMEDVRFLPDRGNAIVQAARLALHGQDKEPEILLAVANAELEGYTMSLADALRVGKGEMRSAFKRLGETLYFPAKGYAKEIEQAASLVEEEPQLLQVLVLWLTDALSDDEWPIDDYSEAWLIRKRNALLEVTAVATERMPATFANAAEPDLLEPLLVKAVKYHEGRTGRRAALTLLSYLRRVTPLVVEALPHALRDVQYVRQSALEAVRRFRRIEGDVLPPLFAMLKHPSATVAYATAQVLSVLGRHQRTSSLQRQQILDALAEAIRDPSSRRGVHLWDVPVKIPPTPRLDHLFYRALVEVARAV